MKKFCAAVVFLGLAVSAQAAPLLTGDASAGQTKAATVCVACHGADGNSMAPTFPRLAGQGARYINKQLHDFKAGLRNDPTMSGMAMTLSDQDIADVAAFFSSQKSGVDQAKPDLVVSGEKIYRGGNSKTGLAACAGCHGPDGAGNALAGFPHLSGQHADYVKKQLTAFRAAGRGDTVADPNTQKRSNDAAKAGEVGTMQMVASKLSDAEIDAVASYISGLY